MQISYDLLFNKTNKHLRYIRTYLVLDNSIKCKVSMMSEEGDIVINTFYSDSIMTRESCIELYPTRDIVNSLYGLI